MILPEIKVKVSFDKKVKKSELVAVKSSIDAVPFIRELFDADTFDWTESVVMLLLNRANKIIGYYKINGGGTTSCIIDTKVVMTVALNGCAHAIIFAHNHPSGNTQPSDADRNITNKIVAAGKILDITVLDHIIVTDESYYSFADNGLI